jgi:hypothetical protein
MDIIRLYQDYSVDFLTEGHKHCREGWVNTPCPFCTGNPGYHLGYNIDDNYYMCWRCGWHPLTTTIATLLNVSEQQTKKILRQYGILVPRLQKPPTTDIKKVEHTFPSGVGAMGIMHKIYLDNRKFDPEKLEKEWGLLGTGPVSKLDNINYRFRIIIPFIWEGQQVSFDSRDITGKHPSKYMACPKHREIIPHKEILYGRQDKWKETGILVEGPTDVWRLGTSSFAVSGIKYTNQQVREIFRVFKRVAVVFDDDPQAVVQANKIVAELKFRGVDAFRVDIEGDPGGMPQDEADYLVKQLIK